VSVRVRKEEGGKGASDVRAGCLSYRYHPPSAHNGRWGDILGQWGQCPPLPTPLLSGGQASNFSRFALMLAMPPAENGQIIVDARMRTKESVGREGKAPANRNALSTASARCQFPGLGGFAGPNIADLETALPFPLRVSSSPPFDASPDLGRTFMLKLVQLGMWIWRIVIRRCFTLSS
jgi:hypothetical protein